MNFCKDLNWITLLKLYLTFETMSFIYVLGWLAVVAYKLMLLKIHDLSLPHKNKINVNRYKILSLLIHHLITGLSVSIQQMISMISISTKGLRRFVQY